MGRSEPRRVTVWFSCGATSAVAAKLTAKEYAGTNTVSLVYTDPGSEHPDNLRFLKDVEEWVGIPVTILKSSEYRDHWDVIERRRYLSGPHGGAPCTQILKKKLRQEYERPYEDISVFGFDASEEDRAARFRKNNPEVDLRTPLIDRSLTKDDCLAILERAGVVPPAMYREPLLFGNANCVGCVKASSFTYWHKIREHFPDVFDRMAKLERELNAAICKTYAGDGKRKRVFLDELDPAVHIGRDDEPMPECSLLCVAAEAELTEVEDGAE